MPRTHQALHPIQMTPHSLQSLRANTHQHTVVTHAQQNRDTFPPQVDIHQTRPNIWRDSFPSIPQSTCLMCHFTRLEPHLSPPKTCSRLHVRVTRHTQSCVLTVILAPRAGYYQSVCCRCCSSSEVIPSFFSSIVV